MNLSIQILDSPSQLTGETKDAFYQCVESKSRSGADWIGIDLSRLNSIDELGLGILSAAQKVTAQNNKKLILFSPQSHIKDGLRSTGISQLITVHDSFDALIHSATKKSFTDSSRRAALKSIMLPNQLSSN